MWSWVKFGRRVAQLIPVTEDHKPPDAQRRLPPQARPTSPLPPPRCGACTPAGHAATALARFLVRSPAEGGGGARALVVLEPMGCRAHGHLLPPRPATWPGPWWGGHSTQPMQVGTRLRAALVPSTKAALPQGAGVPTLTVPAARASNPSLLPAVGSTGPTFLCQDLMLRLRVLPMRVRRAGTDTSARGDERWGCHAPAEPPSGLCARLPAGVGGWPVRLTRVALDS